MLKKLLSVFVFAIAANASANSTSNWLYLETKNTDEFYLNTKSVKGSYPYYFGTIGIIGTSSYNLKTDSVSRRWKGQVDHNILVNCSNKTYTILKTETYNSDDILITYQTFPITNSSWKSFDLDFYYICK